MVAESRLGGGGANTAVALAAAGHEVMLLTAVGQDSIGDKLLAELAARGVDATAIVRLHQPSTRSLLLIDPLGERTVINVARCEEDVPSQRLLTLRADLIYVRSRRDDLSALLRARAATSLIVAHAPPIEAGSRPAHIVVASASDLDPHCLQAPQHLGAVVSGGLAQWTVITDGAAGAYAYSEGQRLTVSARCVQALDTTGAGDAFAAGLIHGVVNQWPMSKALALAVQFGTEATLWPASGLPTVAVRRLVEEI